ncbi:MAG: oppD, partial [Herbinix sp.]|nr:oppD [Herbinix sp.]
KIVEIGTAEDIFYRSSHPYTKALLRSLPTTDMDRSVRLVSIAGTPPDLLNPPVGCGFASRCKNCMKICHTELPPQFEVEQKHLSACWLHHEDCPSARDGGEQ